MKALAAPIEEIPASLSSFGKRSSSVWNARSERPRACGEQAPVCSTPSRFSAGHLRRMPAIDLAARLGVWK